MAGRARRCDPVGRAPGDRPAAKCRLNVVPDCGADGVRAAYLIRCAAGWQCDLPPRAEYRLKIVDTNGLHVRTVTRDIRPRRVTQRDQDAFRARRAAAGPARPVVLGGSGNAPATMPSIPTSLSEPSFAEVMAVISEVRTDASGRMWVQRRDADGADRGPGSSRTTWASNALPSGGCLPAGADLFARSRGICVRRGSAPLTRSVLLR
jgi:hypothetical protein